MNEMGRGDGAKVLPRGAGMARKERRRRRQVELWWYSAQARRDRRHGRRARRKARDMGSKKCRQHRLRGTEAAPNGGAIAEGMEGALCQEKKKKVGR